MGNSMKKKLDIAVIVSRINGKYEFDFKVDGHVDKDGNVTVKSAKKEAVTLEFSVEKGKDVADVEFHGSAADSIVVGDEGVENCPPTAGNEFDEHEHDGKNRKKVKVTDKKTRDGYFKYALWFNVTRNDGAVDIECCDPMIINN